MAFNQISTLKKVDIQNNDSTNYLGCIFDPRLNRRSNTERLKNKAIMKLPVQKCLASATQGCDRETLITIYKLCIQPIIGYCGEILIKAPENVIQMLDVFRTKHCE